MYSTIELLDRTNAALEKMQTIADSGGFGEMWAKLPIATLDQKIHTLRLAWGARSVVCASAIEAAMRVAEEACSVVPDWRSAEFWTQRVEEYARGLPDGHYVG